MISYEKFTFMLFALGYSTIMVEFVTFYLEILFAKGLNHNIFRMFDTQLQFYMKVLCQVNQVIDFKISMCLPYNVTLQL